jgi:hypothetical protein
MLLPRLLPKPLLLRLPPKQAESRSKTKIFVQEGSYSLLFFSKKANGYDLPLALKCFTVLYYF